MAATYSLEDIKAHKTRTSLWLTVHHKVYDVTKFIDEVGVEGRWYGKRGTDEAVGGRGGLELGAEGCRRGPRSCVWLSLGSHDTGVAAMAAAWRPSALHSHRPHQP
jgi:hypothetical protein